MECVATILKCHFSCCGSSEQEDNSEVDPKDNRRWQISSSDISIKGGPSKWKKLSSWLQSLQPRHPNESIVETGNETPLTVVPTEASSEYLTDQDHNDTTQSAPFQFRAFHDDNSERLEKFQRQNSKLKKDVFLTTLHNKKHLFLSKYYSKSIPFINDNSSSLSHGHHTRFLRRFSDSHLFCKSSRKLIFIDLCDEETNISEFYICEKGHNLKYAEKSNVDTSAHFEIKQIIWDKLYSLWNNTTLLPKKPVGIDSNFTSKASVEDLSVDVKRACTKISKQLLTHKQPINVESHINIKSKNNTGSEQIEYLVQADNILAEPKKSYVICKTDRSDIIFPIKRSVDCEETNIYIEGDNDVKLPTPTYSISTSKSNFSSRRNDSVIGAWKQVQQVIGNLKAKLKEKCLSETASENSVSSPDLLKICNSEQKNQNFNIENEYSFTPSVDHAAQSVKVCTVMSLESQSHCKEKMSRKSFNHFPDDCVEEPSYKHRAVLVNNGFEEDNVPIRPQRGKLVAKYVYTDEQNCFLTQKENSGSSHEGSIEASRRAFTYNMIHGDTTDEVATCGSTSDIDISTELFDSYYLANEDPELNNISEDPKNISKENVNVNVTNSFSSKNIATNVSIKSDINLRDVVKNNECESIPNEYKYVFNKPKLEPEVTQFSCLRDNNISMDDVFEPKCDSIKDMPTRPSRKISDNSKKVEKKSVDITFERNKDILIFTSKLDIEIIKNVSSNTEQIACEDNISSTPIDNCAIICDIRNESDVLLNKEINYNSKILCSSREATQTPESSYSLYIDNLHNQTNSKEESDPLCNQVMFNKANHDTKPHIFLKEDSQPQIFVTPADGSNENKCSDVLTSNSFEDSNLSQNDDYVYSPSFANVHCSVESHIDSSSVLSEIDGLFPNEGYIASPCLTPTTIKSRPTTPKSPITVQEWVDSLPNNPTAAEQRDVDHDDDVNDWRDDMQNFISDEQFHLLHKRRQTRESIADETLFLGDEAAALAPILLSKDDALEECDQSLLSLDEQKRPPPPLTLHDIHNVMSKSDGGVVKSWHGEAIGRRSRFADTRDMQASFQSEASNLSFFSHQTTASSIESLLESRQADPVDILLNLGFGGGDEDDGLSRIPSRFLKPSQVPGNDINMFLKQEDNISDLVDSSDWVVPGISAQGGWASSPHLIYHQGQSSSPRSSGRLASSNRLHRSNSGLTSSVPMNTSNYSLSSHLSLKSSKTTPPLWMFSPLIVQSMPSHDRPQVLSLSNFSPRAASVWSAPASLLHKRSHYSRPTPHYQFQQYLTVNDILSPQSDQY